jgi:site-specific DNA-adenine methylase
MMIQAILENLYKPVRDDIGQQCSHLDPLNTCQTIRVMITHFVNEMKGKYQLFLVVCTEKILTYALLLFVFTRECDRKKNHFTWRPVKETNTLGLKPETKKMRRRE